MRNPQIAFHWIVDILEKNQAAFQITGGLAAQVYGSRRELADIDIDVHEKEWADIMPEITEHIVFGPGRYQDANWDLYLLTLNYLGQPIDISSTHRVKVFDQNQQTWVVLVPDLTQAIVTEIFGRKVPVVHRDHLIEYKSKLRRPVDLLDLQAISH